MTFAERLRSTHQQRVEALSEALRLAQRGGNRIGARALFESYVLMLEAESAMTPIGLDGLLGPARD